MSAILGPIHHWLFRKIKIQNDLTNAIIDVAKDKELNVAPLADIDEKFGSLPEGDLGNIIDPTNIHGSGMPCDGVNMIVNEDSDEITWQETVDIHKQYWDEVGVDVALFYEIRNAMIEGVFAGSDLSYYNLGNGSYKLVKE